MKTPSAIKFKKQILKELKFDTNNSEEILAILHLLLEDIKLDQVLWKQESQKLRKLLVRLILAFADPKYANHLAFYLQEDQGDS